MSTLDSYDGYLDSPLSSHDQEVSAYGGGVPELSSDSLQGASVWLSRFKTKRKEDYETALSNLKSIYFLSEEDMEGYDYALYILLTSTDSGRSFFQIFIHDDELIRRSVCNVLKESNIEDSPDSEINDLVSRVKRELAHGPTSMKSFLEPAVAEIIEMEEESVQAEVLTCREGAVELMDSMFPDFFRNLKDNRHELDDETMVSRFRTYHSEKLRYLTTYFDSAAFGLVDKQAEAALISKIPGPGGPEWDKFIDEVQKRTTEPLERLRSFIQRRRFGPQGVSFQRSGTSAFLAFVKKHMKGGQRVLVTDEEYIGMHKAFAEQGVNIKVLPQLRTDVAEYRGQIQELLLKKPYDYLLVSEVSRYGTRFPLSVFHEAREAVSPDTKLIVDMCQSAGRIRHDLGVCKTDVAFYSTSKGGETGSSVGVLALARDFDAPENDPKLWLPGMGDLHATESTIAIAGSAYSMDNTGLVRGNPGLTPAEKDEAVTGISKKFVDMLRHMWGNGHGHRIKILRPQTYDQLAHVVEIKVEGVPRERISELAEEFGVHIASHYDDPYDDESVRIAFHPYMGNDALKMLGYVLLKAAKD